MSTEHPSLAVLVKGWPRLSETFIAQELVALEEAGLDFEIWSLRHPTDVKRHPLHERLRAKVRYLPEYLYQEPDRVWAARAVARKALQVHGAIGYTFEHDLHLWMKRAWALSSAWGDPTRQLDRIAEHVLGADHA